MFVQLNKVTITEQLNVLAEGLHITQVYEW